MTTHDQTLFTTLPNYPDTTEIPFTDLDLDLNLNDVFAPGMLESQAHWDLDLDMPGKPSGVFPVPNDFGFNYPVDLVELEGLGLGFEGEGDVSQDHTQNTINTLLRTTTYQATQRALYMTTPTTPQTTTNSPQNPLYAPTSPTSSHNSNPSDTISISNSDTDSISFGPRTPPPHTPIYTYDCNDPTSKKRKASTEIDLDTGIHPYNYTMHAQPGGGEGEFSVGVLAEEEQIVSFYPSLSPSGNHPKRRRSSVPDRDQEQPQPQSQSPYQEPDLESDQDQDIFTPLEMPDGSTRFTSNWLPVDSSGGFTICPDPLAGVMGEAFVSVGG
ncbi:hypothetical protein BDV24DRAFT_171299 [Aspergillus arachidicola]|uniref:Uncharacterized protein n=1 Tax=Aspergillus arachidicola TaxID=656916 RepID=A0A5N6YJH6_9EURO|nr:hypothetical protein BDV24DRAFT_171299 [Aspergillus arachidicola]